MAAAENVLRVFLPFNMLTESCGIIHGLWSSDGNIACLTSLHRGDDASPWKPRAESSGILGLWQNASQCTCNRTAEDGGAPNGVHGIMGCGVRDLQRILSGSRRNGFLLENLDGVDLPTCSLLEGNCRSFTSVIVIVYDAQKLQQSNYLMDLAYRHSTQNGLQEKSGRNSTNLELLTEMLARSEKAPSLCTEGDDVTEDRDVIRNLVTPERGLKSTLGCVLELLCHTVFKGYFSVSARFDNRLMKTWVARKVTDIPTVCSQLRYKYNYMSQEIPHRNGSPQKTLRYKNCLTLFYLDILFGVMLMLWMFSENRTTLLAETIMQWAEHVVSELHILLEWLMGVPAGLKLNSQLDQLLGKFFQYHVFLWTGYLGVLRPVLADALWCITLMGCLGVSIQLSLVQDLISMLTMHIYCFYVYAARLYSLQVYGLASLWRLFRGKKWNVLRQRVDTSTYDVDQLFIGTLLFTVLLFLLPTTALYYVVFTLLRLLILSAQGCLHKVVTAINYVPIYSLLLRLFHPIGVADNVTFTVLGKDANDALYVSLKTVPADVSTIVRSDRASVVSDKPEEWAAFLRKLCLGHLVYPWIEPST